MKLPNKIKLTKDVPSLGLHAKDILEYQGSHWKTIGKDIETSHSSHVIIALIDVGATIEVKEVSGEKKITSKHLVKEKGMPNGWSHARKIEEKHLLLAIHENLIHIGKLLEKSTD